MKIIDLLVKYECLEKAQLARLCNPSAPNLARTFMNEHEILSMLTYKDNTVQLRTKKPKQPDKDLIASIWAMLILCDGHMEDVDHAPDAYPFALRFVAEGKTYRVLPVHENMPSNALHALSQSDNETALLLLLDGSVPEDLIIPEGAPVIFITYRRPDKWGKPIIKAYLDKTLSEEI